MSTPSPRLKLLLRSGRGGVIAEFAIFIALIVFVAVAAVVGLGGSPTLL